MTKAVRVLAILAPLAAWPAVARAQEPGLMNCKTEKRNASYDSIDKKPLKIEGREGAMRYIFRGDVRITCDEMTVAADEIESVSDETTVTLRGHVVFKDTGMSITADLAVVDQSTHLGTFYTVSGAVKIGEPKPGDLFGGLEPDAYFSGESLKKTGPKTYVLTNGVLTTCTQPTPRWYMSFSGTITVGKHVIMHDLVLRVKSVPLLYLPAFYYPITENGRNTGFLMPSYGSSSVSGFTLNNAFFLVLGRSMDATFFHTYMKKTGTSFGSEYRYVESSGHGNAAVTVINQKAQVATGTSTIIAAAQTSYRFTGSFNQRLPHGLSFISNDSYFSSASAQQLYQQNVFDLSRRQSQLNGTLSGFGYHGYLRFSVQAALNDVYTGSQAPSRNGTLPMGSFTFTPKPIGRGKLNFNLNGTSGYILRQDKLDDPTTDRSLWRTDVQPTISASVSTLSFLRVTTQASWRLTTWSESTTADDQAHNVPVGITRQLFTASVSIAGPSISKVYLPKPNGYAESLKHTITPVFNLSWNSPFSDFRRVVQLDYVDSLVGGTVSMDYGIRTSLRAKRWTAGKGSDTSRQDIVTASISQSYYSNLLAAAYSQQDSSTAAYNAPAASPFTPVSLFVEGKPVEFAAVRFRTRYDTHFSALREYSVEGGLSRPLVQIFGGWNKKNLIPGLPNYDTPESTRNYLNANVTLTHPNRHFGGRYESNLDLKLSQFLQQRFLFYYNSQCCGISFDYQTVGAGAGPGLPADRRFSFSFTLAGIGSFSNPFGSFGGGGSK